jgi:hypothetical protein
MRFISAPDSVSLAIQRTREFLFRPFRWGTYLKLGLVAIITEGIGSNLRLLAARRSIDGTRTHDQFAVQHPSGVDRGDCGGRAARDSSLPCDFYLITRLRFAFFHCLIHNIKEIRPGWRLYREQATRFFWLNLGVGVLLLAAGGLGRASLRSRIYSALS